MLLQLERERLQSDLAKARAMLADAPRDEDPIEHHQFTERVRDLEATLDKLKGELSRAPVGVAIFFGGGPVVGSEGIKASFAAQAVQGFQKLVSQRAAADATGPLASHGRVPLSQSTQLLVTDVVRGSFGFVLQAAEPQPGSDVRIKEAVDDVAATLQTMAAADEMSFDPQAMGVDSRQLGTLRDFFKLLDDEAASLRVVEGERDFELDRPAVSRARQRVDGLRIEETPETISGLITGWMSGARKFELRAHDGASAIVGGLSPDVVARVTNEQLNPFNRHVRASVKVTTIHAKNRLPRRAYSLLSFEPIDAPPHWNQAAQLPLA